ncbi:MAG: hypothetical protein PHR28_12760 [candidate division Zixibacteria bacterium]|nr:hypothetical protein [candidate division Zixibacteria bacterium]
MFTYFRRSVVRTAVRWSLIAAVGLAAAVSCGGKQADRPEATPDKKGKGKTWNRADAEAEYRFIQSELSLIKSGKPYLVLDFKRDRLVIKLKGATVWSYPMAFAEGDAGEVARFQERYQGDGNRLVRTLTGKHLFAAKGQTPDSVLAIVGSAVMVDPNNLQRELPERFQLHWGDNLVLEVRTDITGTPVSRFHNAMIEIGKILYKPFGEAILVVKIDPEEGLTLYRATPVGMATLIYPPSQ